MSTIRVDNFGPAAGGTTYSARGIAKAWVNFNGTGTIAIRDSLNVASLTDVGVGGYNLSFTNNYSAIGWVAISSGQWDSSNGLSGDGTSSTSSIVLISGVFYPLAVQDDSHYQSAGFGDLA